MRGRKGYGFIALLALLLFSAAGAYADGIVWAGNGLDNEGVASGNRLSAKAALDRPICRRSRFGAFVPSERRSIGQGGLLQEFVACVKGLKIEVGDLLNGKMVRDHLAKGVGRSDFFELQHPSDSAQGHHIRELYLSPLPVQKSHLFHLQYLSRHP